MLGDMLRKERERQNLSIRDIEQGTSIRAVYIEAIEKEDWAALPGDVYAKGFVRNYANFLKIDADACVGQYHEEVQSSPAAPPQPEPVYQNPNAESIFPSGDDYRNRVEHTHKSQNKLLLAMIALVLAGGAYFAFGAMDDSTNADPKPAQKQVSQKADAGKKGKQPTAAAPAKAPAESASAPAAAQPATPSATAQPTAAGGAGPASTTAQAATPANAGGDIDLRAQFTDRCWMRVVADGQVVYEGTAQKGQAMSWKAKNQIVITAGNAGAVDITQNGKLLGNPGDYGSVVEKTYSKATLPQ